jgi:hypothetical protein
MAGESEEHASGSGSSGSSSAPTLSEKERRTCPDCAGTNFWYPQGPDKGVARCRHATLRPGAVTPEA